MRRATRAMGVDVFDALFQSTPSMRRATLPNCQSSYRSSFQSTLSMRRATHAFINGRRLPVFQSTLSMRRATFPRVGQGDDAFRISIHALHEESDSVLLKYLMVVSQFQSTLSMRRATHGCCTIVIAHHFNPRSP